MARGIKSFELLKSANRWYIVEVFWDWERPDNPIPEHYLHDSLKQDGFRSNPMINESGLKLLPKSLLH
jgi:hypothetical protein